MTGPPKEEGRTEDAAHFKSNKQQSSLSSDDSPVKTYGPLELCAWSVDRGVFWFQTRDRKFARKLAKRNDARRVGIDGYNHFRQTFELCGTWRKVRRIIDRYILSAGDHNSGSVVVKDCSKIVPRVKTAGVGNGGLKSVSAVGCV
jgi:hypothetical protein